MRTLLTLLILLLNATAVVAQNSDSYTLTLNFEITKDNKGQILFAMYDSAEGHMEDTYKTSSAKVKNSKVTITVEGLKPGYYSFSYFHDVNSNGELDTNLVGIPKEPYGFSNGEKGRLGPPDFEDCKIKIDNDTNIQISIK
jgi:uncharacterized protein (DUF2141 family)